MAEGAVQVNCRSSDLSSPAKGGVPVGGPVGTLRGKRGLGIGYVLQLEASTRNQITPHRQAKGKRYVCMVCDLHRAS